ncbi:hypothetical protein BpHYR1_009138 [Brachionus plicatilis]|uniref:Uncharacterized protein n=1 Tax=Brachionus plicatilis TaxID=10195 RepID=A0A3M7Q0L4_BRAPC|nr:hypothetical protein BpHYR1_009138 [Brachionus plicatilis]
MESTLLSSLNWPLGLFTSEQSFAKRRLHAIPSSYFYLQNLKDQVTLNTRTGGQICCQLPGTMIKSGHNSLAINPGMAALTPNRRAIIDSLPTAIGLSAKIGKYIKIALFFRYDFSFNSLIHLLINFNSEHKIK